MPDDVAIFSNQQQRLNQAYVCAIYERAMSA